MARRQRDGKGAALAFDAFHRDRSAMRLDDVPDHGQPSPVPRIPPEVDAAPRTNFWNTAFCSDAGMPIP